MEKIKDLDQEIRKLIARTPEPKEDFYGQLLPSRKFPIHLWSSASYMENQSKMYNKKKNNRLKSQRARELERETDTTDYMYNY